MKVDRGLPLRMAAALLLDVLRKRRSLSGLFGQLQSAGSSVSVLCLMMLCLPFLLSVVLLACSFRTYPIATSPSSPSQYKAMHSFSGSQFLDDFDFYTGPDLTHGLVS
jgi:hypothetical protein